MPETKVFRMSDTYLTNNGTPLQLTVSIGNANPGGIAVSWEDQVVSMNPDELKEFVPSDGFYGKRMVIAVLTRDVHHETNMTSIVVQLKTGDGEGLPRTWELNETASEDGLEVLYDIVIDAV